MTRTSRPRFTTWYSTYLLGSLLQRILIGSLNPHIRSWRKLVTRASSVPDINPTELNQQRLIYLHGRCPDSAGVNLIEERCVLTRTSYDTAYRVGSLQTVVKALFQGCRILFIGTGFNDHPVVELLSAARSELEGNARLAQGAPVKST